MGRMLVVDHDVQTRRATGVWPKQCDFKLALTDGGASGLKAMNDGAFDVTSVCPQSNSTENKPRNLQPSPARRRAFREREQIWAELPGRESRRSLLSSTSTRWRNHRHLLSHRRVRQPQMIASEEWLD